MTTIQRRNDQGLVFYERSHRYKLDGKWVPGVTTLIKDGLPNKALMYWSARTVAEFVADNPDDVDRLRQMGRNAMVAALKEAPWTKRDRAGIRGTEVHALAQQLVETGAAEVPEHLHGHVQSCAAFLDDWGIRPVVVERPIAHRAHWWAGTPDLFAHYRRGTILADYKTADSGIWPEAAYQQSAYRHGEFFLADDGTEQAVPEVDLVVGVHIRADGYDVYPLRADAEVYKEFRHIAAVARAAKRAKGGKNELGYVGLPMEPPSEGAA